MYPLASTVGVKRCIPCSFCLGGRHALEVKCVNGVRDVLFHDCKDLLLPLKGAHSVKRRRDDSDMEMVTGTMQVNDFNSGVWDCFEHFCFNPFGPYHVHASTLRVVASSLNLRMKNHCIRNSDALENSLIFSKRAADCIAFPALSTNGLKIENSPSIVQNRGVHV